MKDTKKGHMLKLHSYYESYVCENIWLTTLNFSFTFPPTQQHFFFFISQILQSTQAFPLSFSLPYALDALLSFDPALSLIVPLVLLVETTSEKDRFTLSHTSRRFQYMVDGKKRAEKLSLWRQEHAVEAFHMVVDQEANSEAENRGQVRTFTGPFLVPYSYQLGLMSEKF